jgi:hypothetical protein
MNPTSPVMRQAFVPSPCLPRGNSIVKQTMGCSQTTSPARKIQARPLEDPTEIPEAEEQTLEGSGPPGRWPWHSRGVVLTPTPPPRGFVSATHRRTTTKKKTRALSAQRRAAMSKLGGTRLQKPAGQLSVATRKPFKAFAARKTSRVSTSALKSSHENNESN